MKDSFSNVYAAFREATGLQSFFSSEHSLFGQYLQILDNLCSKYAYVIYQGPTLRPAYKFGSHIPMIYFFFGLRFNVPCLYIGATKNPPSPYE